MIVEIIAKDNIHPDIWHNDKIGQTFEVAEVKNDAIPPVYIVKYNHPSGRADTAAVVFSCAKQITGIIMNRENLTRLAKQAALAGPMVAHYPEPDNPKTTFPPSPYYRFLKLLAEEMGSRLSVELGVCGGGGSLHLAMGSAQVIGVDVALEYPDNIRWIRRNYDNFKFLNADSVQSAPIIHSNFGDVDILFIDTTHTYEQTMAEYFAYDRYLSGRAVVCLDDLFRPGMDLVWAEMPENKARFDFLHPSASPTDGGFGVIWK